MNMQHFGLLGRKLGHSDSPFLHSLFGSYEYKLYEVEPQELDSFLTARAFDGLNVTVPYKKSVMPYCDVLTPQAVAADAVNTLLCRDGRLIGDNTDIEGFAYLIEKSGISLQGKQVAVLGNGGAAGAVRAVLQNAGADFFHITRSGEHRFDCGKVWDGVCAVVNATPVGMYPHNGESVISLDAFPDCRAVFDLIANPFCTALCHQARTKNIPFFSGVAMLVSQAKAASERFTGITLPDESVETAIAALYRKHENIVLIGMPGSGKSVLGKTLREITGKPFVDTDDCIAQRVGSVPEYLSRVGETAFRQTEHEVIAEVTARRGQIIATGGGAVCREDNLPLLRQNGRVVFLDRPLSELSTENRPLSQRQGVEALAAARMPRYRSWSDVTVSVDPDPKKTADAVLQLLYKTGEEQ